MLDRRSALASATTNHSKVLKLEEAPDFSLTQVAGEETAIAAIAGALPEKVGQAVAREERTIFCIGPRQFWFVGPAGDDIGAKLDGSAAVTPLSNGRTRILIAGAPARDVLAKGLALDFHPSAFGPGTFALAGLHHTPVLIHCIADDAFHLYAMRTFAMSVWDWLRDAAQEFT
ncbi:MAG: hypothetical protein FJX63_03355 [Alphaproteobacteria bacterium]|nr:hypothetical protein [Alphaproteobacteria bacterium]